MAKDENGVEEVYTENDIKKTNKGISYVDALHRDKTDHLDYPDHVGEADVLLSYSWGERYQSIFTALKKWAEDEKRLEVPKKRTAREIYVWICSICLNREFWQHDA
jgi:hypothetical protein